VQKTNIEWTDFTANPLKYRRKSDGQIVWACIKTSPGCAHCYSETLALRYNRGKLFNAKNKDELEPFIDDDELWQIMSKKKAQGIDVAGKKCFLCDMTDLFGAWVSNELIDKVMAVIAYRRDVTFQVLTKRSERMHDYFAENSLNDVLTRQIEEYDAMGLDMKAPEWLRTLQGVFRVTEDWHARKGDECKYRLPQAWPLDNLWLGVSAENQDNANERIPWLISTPAAVRFVSYEPALGPVTFEPWLNMLAGSGESGWLPSHAFDQIIVGGESGPGKRPFDPEWARSVLRECLDADVAFFMKQWDKVREIPDDLMVREFPKGVNVPI
jgi:protein gp37